MIGQCIASLLLLVGAPAFANDASGTWVLKAGDIGIYRLQIHKTGAGWSGEWSRPTSYVIDGDSFKRVTGPVIKRRSTSGSEQEGWTELRFADPEPNSLPDIFLVRSIDSTLAEVRYNGARLGTLRFVAERSSAPFGLWEPSRTYTYLREGKYTTNIEMSAMFDADQKARSVSAVDWKVVGEQDRQRRARTQELINSGALHSGDDFFHAAFIFQHGDNAEDYLKAHILSTISAARGNAASVWLSAATLDRYLQRINRPQVFGTQFLTVNGKTGQEPFDKGIISDALRDDVRVPPLNDQETQRELIEQAISRR